MMKMNDKIRVFKLLIFAVLTVSSCSQKEKMVSPERSADGQNIVLLQDYINSQYEMVAMEGQSGNLKWSKAYRGTIIASDRMLYFQDLERPVNQLQSYQDTINLYAIRDTTSNFVALNALNGQKLWSVHNEIKPGYMVNCCNNGQYNKLLAVTNNIALMYLQEGTLTEILKSVLYAAEVKTGKILWSVSVRPWLKLNVVESKIYIGGNQNSYTLDLHTGTRLNDLPFAGLDNPVAGQYYTVREGKVISLSTTGAISWEFETGKEAFIAKVYKGTVYAMTSVLGESIVYALDNVSGKLKWQSKQMPYMYYSSLDISDNTMYVGAADGILYALSTDTGSPRWSYVVGNGLNGGYASGVKVKGSNLYFFGNNKLIVLDSANGKKIWEHPVGASASFSVFDKSELEF